MSEAPPSLAESWSLPANVTSNRTPVEVGNDENTKDATSEEVVSVNAEALIPVEETDATAAEKTDEPIVEKTGEASAEKVDEIPTDDKGNEGTSEEKPVENSPEEQGTEAPEEESGEQEAVEEKPTIKIETAPADFRFPTTNQTRHCFTRYIEYHRCIQVKGEEAPECEKFAKYYRSLCPSDWIERWNEQRANGTFPGPL